MLCSFFLWLTFDQYLHPANPTSLYSAIKYTQHFCLAGIHSGKKIRIHFEWKYLWTYCLLFIIKSKGLNYQPHFELSWCYFGEKQFGLQVHCMTQMMVSLAEFVGRYNPLSFNVKSILNESVKVFWYIFIIYIHAGPSKLKLANTVCTWMWVWKKSMPWTAEIFLNPNPAFLMGDIFYLLFTETKHGT